jgi:hypothetical protein
MHEKLRQARAELEIAFEQLTQAYQAHAAAHVEYHVQYGEPPPFPLPRDDPKLTLIFKAQAEARQAEERRDAAFVRIREALPTTWEHLLSDDL